MTVTAALDTSPTTRFGSSAASLQQAGSLLRASASAMGVPLQAVNPVDLAAAVVGADAWSHAVGASSLHLPGQYGQDAVIVLAAVLQRAAGVSQACDPCDTLETASTTFLGVAEGYRRWTSRMVGDLHVNALQRAAHDLMSAGPESRFAGFAGTISLTIEELPTF